MKGGCYVIIISITIIISREGRGGGGRGVGEGGREGGKHICIERRVCFGVVDSTRALCRGSVPSMFISFPGRPGRENQHVLVALPVRRLCWVCGSGIGLVLNANVREGGREGGWEGGTETHKNRHRHTHTHTHTHTHIFSFSQK